MTELSAQLRTLKCENAARNKEIEALKREMEILRNTVRPGTSGVANPGTSVPGVRVEAGSSHPDGELPQVESGDLTTSVPGVALKPLPSFPLPQRPRGPGAGSEKGNRDVNRGKSIDSCKAVPRLNATVSDVEDTPIDEVIYNLIELRNIHRPHLAPLRNPLEDNLAIIPPPDPSIPPKRGRGRPKIIKNVQVVPSRVALREVPISVSDTGGASTPQTAVTIRSEDWTPVVRRRRAKKNRDPVNRSRISAKTRKDRGTVSAPPPLPGAPGQGRRRSPRLRLRLRVPAVSSPTHLP